MEQVLVNAKKELIIPSGGLGHPENRERRLKLLEDRKSRYEESVQCEFTADEALIGLIIGKQGEKLTRVAREYKVEIRVLPDDNGVRRVRIYGADVKSVEQARSVLEYVYHEHHVPEDTVNWILRKKGSSIKDIAQRAGLHSAWFDDTNRVILLCGLRHTVNKAAYMLSTQTQCFQDKVDDEEEAGGVYNGIPAN